MKGAPALEAGGGTRSSGWDGVRKEAGRAEAVEVVGWGGWSILPIFRAPFYSDSSYK